MRITNNGKGEKFLTLSKAEYDALKSRYKFIRDAQVVDTQPVSPTTPPAPAGGSDANLPAFMQKVDGLYRQMFNMPGGLPDSLREQIATSVRGNIQNTQTPTPNDPIEGDDMGDMSDSVAGEPAFDNPMGGDQGIENTELDTAAPEDAINPNGVVDDLNGNPGALEDDLGARDGFSNEPIDDPDALPDGAHQSRVDQRSPVAPDSEGTNFENEGTETGDLSEPVSRSTRLDNFMGDRENGPAKVVESPGVVANRLDPSHSVYRSGSKFANGVDFEKLTASLKPRQK
jgi:hypothetical protein